MSAPTRFPAGVGVAPRGTTLRDLPLLHDPASAYQYFNDFSNYVAGDWTVTVIGTGSNALVTGEPFGAVASTNSAADNDGVQSQLTKATFTMSATKKAWFKTRMKISDATQSDLIIGLCSIDTTLLGAVDGAGVTDGIFFSKDDGDTHLDVQCQKDATTGQNRTADIAELADDTYVTLGWYFDANAITPQVHFYVNDVHTAALSATSAYLPDAALTVSFGLLNGEAVAKALTVDYLLAAIER